MKISSNRFTAAVVVAAALAVVPALAQAPAARVVTRDELRACMSSASKLAADRQSLTERGAKTREEVQAVGAELQEITAEKARAEEKGGLTLDRFNRKVKSHNARSEAVRQSAERIAKDEDVFNAETLAYNASCGRISFKPEDKEAILQEAGSPAK
jgi:hypothetical protein